MQAYRFSRLIFTPEDGRLFHPRSRRESTLRPQAARLLVYLLDHAGEVIARERLFAAVWGENAVVDFESGLAALMRELRQAVRSAGGPEDLIETVPRRGYRLTAQVRTAGKMPRRGWRLAAILAALLLVTGYGLWLALGGTSPDRRAGYRLAILPFESYERSADLPEHVGLRLADTLLAELLRQPVEGLELIGRTGLRPYLGREDVVFAVAADLGVELLIEGAVTSHAGQGWQAELRLLAVPPGRVVWSTTVAGPPGAPLDVRAVSATMAGELVAAWPALRRQLGGDD